MRPDIEVLWHSALLRSSEHFKIFSRSGGRRLEGLVVLPIAGVPASIRYEVDVDESWRTRGMRASVGGNTTIVVEVADGLWSIDGVEDPALEGCIDIDLGWTPATNTLPINRLGLGMGESDQIEAAWLRFPDLTFVRSAQRYTRLSDREWRYQSGDFDAVLEVTPEGVVMRYGGDLWTAAAVSG